jgi:metal-sulfur cluster biosynthetic enzyme
MPATSTVSERDVEAALETVLDPCSVTNGSNLNVVEMGLLREVRIEGSTVHVDLRVTSPMCMMIQYFMKEVEARVGPVAGVERVEVTVDRGFEWTPSMMSEGAKERRRERLRERDRALGREDTLDPLGAETGAGVGADD